MQQLALSIGSHLRRNHPRWLDPSSSSINRSKRIIPAYYKSRGALRNASQKHFARCCAHESQDAACAYEKKKQEATTDIRISRGLLLQLASTTQLLPAL